jgi:hypothetical protein
MHIKELPEPAGTIKINPETLGGHSANGKGNSEILRPPLLTWTLPDDLSGIFL